MIRLTTYVYHCYVTDPVGPTAGQVFGYVLAGLLLLVGVGALGFFAYRFYLARKLPYRVL
jgi:hypothetical protein